MNFEEYRINAKKTDGEQTLVYYVLGLAGEVGEVVEDVKKWRYHGHEMSDMRDELGDVLWYLDRLTEKFGMTLEEIAVRNIEKLHKRYPNGYSDQASRERNDRVD